MGQSAFNFTRQVDLRLPESRQLLITQLNEGNSFSETQIHNMVTSIDFLVSRIGIKGPIVVYPPDILTLETGKNRSTGISLASVIQLGENLQKLQSCSGFNELLVGLSNPTQIMDTIFEVEIAAWCHSLPSVHRLTFSPNVIVAGKLKRPEFLLHTTEGDVYCECKSLHPEGHDSLKRFAEIVKAVEEDPGFPQVPDDLRVDVHLNKGITGDLAKQVSSLTKAISSSIINAEARSLEKSGDFNFRVSKRADNSPFRKFNFAEMRLVLPAGVATQIHMKNAKLRVTFEDKRLTKRIGNLMSDAKKQLPTNKMGVIFIQLYQSHSKEALEAAQKRFQDPTFSHILAIGVWGSGNQFHHRTESTDLVQRIFAM